MLRPPNGDDAQVDAPSAGFSLTSSPGRSRFALAAAGVILLVGGIASMLGSGRHKALSPSGPTRFFSYSAGAGTSHTVDAAGFDAVGYGHLVRVSPANVERFMRQQGFSPSQIQTFIDSAWSRPPVPLWPATRASG